ncbi:MAG: cation-transporting P-type ATPase, partial [Burkholderiales bacterium]|nr:cation-transporting P-type ATPase [Burkholderiales bacterium]
MAAGLPAMDDAYRRPAAEVAAAFGTDLARGLSGAEARARLARCGRNALEGPPPVPRWRRLLAQFESPLVLLLVAAGAISLVVWWIERGEGVPYEALTIFAIVVANALLGFFQEQRAEAAIAGLRRMTAAQATVIRDGERRTVPAAELVPGDLLVVDEGATIPA